MDTGAKDHVSEAHGSIQLTVAVVTILFRSGSNSGFKGWGSWTQILWSQRTEAASGVLCLIQRIHPWVTRAGFPGDCWLLRALFSGEPHLLTNRHTAKRPSLWSQRGTTLDATTFIAAMGFALG